MQEEAHRPPAAPTTVTSQPPLLALPAELRLQIYGLVLAPDKAAKWSSPDFATASTLLHTCTQMRSEAAALFYSSNNFSITVTLSGAQRVADCLQGIGTENASLIPRLAINIGNCAKIDADGADYIYAQDYAAPWDAEVLQTDLEDRYECFGRLVGAAIISAGIRPGAVAGVERFSGRGMLPWEPVWRAELRNGIAAGLEEVE